MKYLKQAAIISVVSFIGEMLHIMIPLPIPASVYGMLILLAALCTNIIKPEQIQETADWLVSVMPVMFVTPLVGIVNCFSSIVDCLIPFFIILLVTTVLVMAVTGKVVDLLMKEK